MTDPQYRLIPVTEAQNRTSRRWAARLVWAIVLAISLILGALYGPVLWNHADVTASPSVAPAKVGNTAFDLQVNSSLIEDQEALADLYAQVAPSVVNIQVRTRGLDFGIPGFDLPDEEGPLQEAQGSGFIYDDQGHIVTNNHVVEDAESVLIIFSSGYWAEAEVVAVDPLADLAVLQVTPPEGMEWRPLPLAEPDSLRVGYTVIAIGNPFGLDGTMTTGIVSALGRGVPVGEGLTSRYTLPDVVQTDAAINPGNSGGPLIDLSGRVVGVNFAIRSQVRANAGVGFAIPVSIVHRVVPALIDQGHYAYAYLGVTGFTISAETAEILGLPNNRLGVYVSEVLADGPSADAGLIGGTESIFDENGVEFARGGDVITAIDDQPVLRFEDLVSYLVTKAEPGQTVTLTVIRDEETLEVPVVLGERPALPAGPTQRAEEPEGISAREAIAIAVEAVEESQLLTGEIEETVAAQEEIDGVPAWVVELSTADATAVVAVDAITGEVLYMGLEE